MRLFKATVEDVPKILPCGVQYTNKIKDMPLDADHWLGTWREFIDAGTGVIYLAEDDNGFIVGGIGGICYPCLLTNRKTAVELFWYTDDEHRGEGVKLYNLFEQWARDEGCERMAMIYLPDSMPAKLDIFYRRKGYFLRECHYEKAI